jgi:hypothetical protein
VEDEAMTSDQRRQAQIKIVFHEDSFHKDSVGRIIVGGETWGAVEWSDKRQAWCVEDAAGRCLRHASSTHGQAAAKEDAIALAERMVRDGTLPAPEEARQRRHEIAQREREKRAKRPSEIRRKEERKQERAERDRMFGAYWKAHHENEIATPFFEIFAEAFDLADPDLWKSNSFALLRPRLVIETRAAIADLEYTLHRAKHPSQGEARLQRARKILALLEEGAP